jgi:uncharacterized protein YxeA
MDNQDIEEFNNLKGVELSELRKTNSTLLGKLNTQDVELSNVFYSITPTELVPFVSWNNLYKVYRGFVPPTVEWLNKSPTVIVLKYVKNKEDKSYDDAMIDLTPNKDAILYFQHEVTIKIQFAPSDVFANLTDAIGVGIVGNSAEKDVVSSFDVLDQQVENYILKDLISNDDTFLNYLTLDESYQTKKTYLTIRFSQPGVKETFTFTITQQSDNGNYIRVKIKGSHGKSVIANFMSVISKLFTIYNSKEAEISAIYKTYGIEIDKPEKEVAKATKQPGGFSRRCPKNKRSLMTLDKQDALDLVDNQENRVMNLPDNGVNKYYTCANNDGYIYPGLTSGQDNDNGVPCCFKKPQVNVPNSRYSKFMSGDNTETSTRTPHILTGNKALGKLQQADLPDTLKRLFNSKLPSQKQSFIRYGVEQSPRSVILCIGKAQLIIEDEYSKNAMLAKQEMYDYSTKEISDMLEDEKAYIDPRKFGTLLGETDKVNIFMFDKNGILKPRYENGYYKRDNNFKSIIIYEQSNISDSQWEIVALVTGKNKQFLFDHDDPISIWLRDSLYLQTRSEMNGVLLPRVSGLHVFPKDWVLKGQMVDASGKTRIVQVQSPTNKILLFQTTPIQPLVCPEILVNRIEPYNTSDKALFKTFMGSVVGKEVDNEMIFILSGEVSISIPLETTEDVVVKSNRHAYIKNKRLSRYMMEYAKWMFAKYGDIANIDTFMEKRVKIVKEHVYRGVTKNFNENNNGLIENGKIIVDSAKTFGQVKFLLKMIILRTPKLFDKYKTMVQIPDYHMEITDFKKNLSISEGDVRDVRDYEFNIFKGSNILAEMIKQN